MNTKRPTTPPKTVLTANGIAYTTSDEAARLLHVTPCRVRQLCSKGRIDGSLHAGRDWLIPVDELLAFAEIPRPIGRPVVTRQ
jgi:hypothetical protein